MRDLLNRTWQSGLLVLVLVFMQACTTNPVTGKRELSLYSRSQQIQIGAQQYEPGQQSQGGVYYLDPALNDYVSRVGQKLAAVSDVPDLPYEFVVLNNSVPNAWALPGGKIAINRGLLVELEDESELAAVLGHEIVHAAAGHGASQLTRSDILGAGGKLVEQAAATSKYGALINQGTEYGAKAWMASYGRNDELESDLHGMRYMSVAGYDPQGAVGLQRKFVELSGGKQQDFISGLFASHPPSQSRVNANIKTVEKLPQGGVTNREAYQRAIAQIKKDVLAYEAEALAIAALNNNNPREAIAQIEVATSIQPREGKFWELKGHALRMLNDNNSALSAYSTAIDKNPAYYQHWLARGALYKDMGRANNAERDLQRSYSLLPSSATAYGLGELVESRGDTSAALGYYQEASSAGGNLGKAAQSKLIRYDLPKNPNKYIRSGIFASPKGQLFAAVENRSGYTAGNIQVRVTNRHSGAAKTIRIRGTVVNGKQATTALGISGDASHYDIVVLTATAQ